MGRHDILGNGRLLSGRTVRTDERCGLRDRPLRAVLIRQQHPSESPVDLPLHGSAGTDRNARAVAAARLSGNGWSRIQNGLTTACDRGGLHWLFPVVAMILLQSPVPPPVVPIEWRAMPLGKLLPLVGAKLGRRLEATQAVADLPVFVRMEPGEKPDVVLDAIARCVSGEWATGTDGVTRLRRNAAAWNKVVEDEKAAVRKGWTLALARKKKKAAALTAPDWDRLVKESEKLIESRDPGTVQTRESAVDAASPGGRLVTRVSAALNAADLAELPPLGLVYADVPTAAQRPLPPGIRAALRAWQSEQSAWFDIARRANLQERADAKDLPIGFLAFRKEDAPTTLGRVVLRVGVAAWNDEAIEWRLRIYNDAGVLVETSGQEIVPAIEPVTYDPDDPSVWKAYAEKVKTAMAREAKSPEHTMSARTLARGKIFGRTTSVPDFPPSPDLLNAVAFDPMAGAESERSAAYSIWRKRTLVQWFDDAAARGETGPTFRAAEGRPWSSFFDFALPDGPVVGRPARPVRAERIMADRSLLTRILQTIGKSGGATLEDRAEVIHVLTGAPVGSIFRSWPGILLQRQRAAANTNPVWSWEDERWMGIYGGLTEKQRAGGQFALSKLSERTRALCYRMIYGVDARNADSVLGDPVDAQFRPQNFANEPTVRWPKGLPDGVLTITREVADVVAARPHDEGSQLFTATAAELAQELREAKKAGTPVTLPREWRAGRRTKVALKLTFAPEVGFAGKLEDVQWSTKSYIPTESLPAPFRNAMKD